MTDQMPTNVTLLENPNLCTLDTCPLSMASMEYIPDLGGQIFFMAFYGFLLIAQIGLGIRYRTWTFTVAMFFGLVGELVGYGGRISLHDNPFNGDAFLQYLVALTIAPAFFTAAIYLILSRVVVAYGEKISYFKPRTYTITFITFDIIALVLQALGGGIASSAPDDDKAMSDLGINIMIAGLAWQVASLFIFSAMSLYFFLRVRKAHNEDFNFEFVHLRAKPYFKASLYALGLATLFIIIRSIFRCAELSEGFDGELANDEVTFMVLEGAMIALAVLCLTAFHPGLVWKSQWHQAVWSTRGKDKSGDYRKAANADSEMSLEQPQHPPTSYQPYNNNF